MLLLVFFELLNTVFALLSDGPCPEVNVVSNMDLTRVCIVYFLGFM